MFEFLRVYQLDIMLVLCGSCGILTLLLLFTRFLSVRRKKILILMEIIALFLLWFDRQAYIYAGVTGLKGYVMVSALVSTLDSVTAQINMPCVPRST